MNSRLILCVLLFCALPTHSLAQDPYDSVIAELDKHDAARPTKAKQSEALGALDSLIQYPVSEIAALSEINEKYTKYVSFIENYQTARPLTVEDVLGQLHQEGEVQQLGKFLGQDVPCIPLVIEREEAYQACDLGDYLAFISSSEKSIPLGETFKELARATLWALYLERMDAGFAEGAHAMLAEAAGDIEVVVSLLSKASSLYESVASKSVLGVNAITVLSFATGGTVGPTMQLLMYHLKFWIDPLQQLASTLRGAEISLNNVQRQIIEVKESKSISVVEADKNIADLLALDKQFVAFIKLALEQQNSLRELAQKFRALSTSTGLSFIETGSSLIDQLNFYIGNIITSVTSYQRPVGDLLQTLASVPQTLEATAKHRLLQIVDERQSRTESVSDVLVRISETLQAQGFPICRGEFSGSLRSLGAVKVQLENCRERNVDSCFRSLTEREVALAALTRDQFLQYANCSLDRVSLAEHQKLDFKKNIETIVLQSEEFLTPKNLSRYGQAMDSVLEKPDAESPSVFYWLIFLVVFVIVFFFLRKWSEDVDRV